MKQLFWRLQALLSSEVADSNPPATFAVEPRTADNGASPFFQLLLSMNSTAPNSEDFFNAARRGDVVGLQAALAAGVPVDAANDKGFTALVLAGYDNHLEATRFLLDQGANPDHRDASGNTALMGIGFKGYADIARLLIERGANPNLRNGGGSTALMFAAMFGRHEMLQLLLDAGADKSFQDGRGFTALQLAGQKGDASAVALLGGAPATNG